jgi:hypothetical protein
VRALLTDRDACDESAARVGAKFMNAIAAVRSFVHQAMELLERGYPISFRVEIAGTIMKNA